MGFSSEEPFSHFMRAGSRTKQLQRCQPDRSSKLLGCLHRFGSVEISDVAFESVVDAAGYSSEEPFAILASKADQ